MLRSEFQAFDEFFVSLLLYLYDNPNSTTVDVAKAILGSDVERQDVKKTESRIRSSLHRLLERGVVVKRDTNPALFSINPTRVTMGHEGHWSFRDGTRRNGNGNSEPKELKVDIGDFMAIQMSDSSIVIRLLNL